jgi:8-amino-3,8-dideoxy-alpha-D-manno-octulosonate transaminase
MTTEPISDEFLLPYEWPGSYFIGEEEIDAVSKVLLARSPYRFYGHNVQHYADKVEDFFRQRLGRKHAVLVTSGTTALSTAMLTADVGPGDEVLLPGYMWVACVSAVVRCGAIPRLVDIDDTYTMNPDDLERKISPRTKAVLLVHMSGACGDIERIVEICKRRGVLLIEDVAQANGASFGGKPLGSFGDIAIYSFQYNKNITAGEGGLVVSDDDALGAKAWAYHDVGYARNAAGRVDMSGAIQTWGQCVHMSEVAAAVLYAQTQKLDMITGKMRARNHQLYQGIGAIAGAQVRRVIDPQGDSGPFVLIRWQSREIAQAMTERTRAAGVKPGPWGVGNIHMVDWGLHIYYNNVSLVEKRPVNSAGRPWSDPLNQFHSEIDYGKGALPQMDDLIDRSILITVPPSLTEEGANRIIEVYQQAARDLGIG